MLKKTHKKSCFLILQSFLFRYLFKDIKILFLYLIKNVNKLGIKNSNFFLPKKIKKFSVVRSPTMSKLSKEQFEFRFYKVYLIFNLESYLDLIGLKNSFLRLNFNYSYVRFSCFFKN
jgi:hypothetical protein